MGLVWARLTAGFADYLRSRMTWSVVATFSFISLPGLNFTAARAGIGTSLPGSFGLRPIFAFISRTWNAPKFRMTMTFADLPKQRTRVVWRMKFATEELRNQIVKVAGDGNEQNFDRWIAQLQASH